MYNIGPKLRQYADEAQKCRDVKMAFAKHMHGKTFLAKDAANRAIAKTGNFNFTTFSAGMPGEVEQYKLGTAQRQSVDDLKYAHKPECVIL